MEYKFIVSLYEMMVQFLWKPWVSFNNELRNSALNFRLEEEKMAMERMKRKLFNRLCDT